MQKSLGVIPAHNTCQNAARPHCRAARVFMEHHPGAQESQCRLRACKQDPSAPSACPEFPPPSHLQTSPPAETQTDELPDVTNNWCIIGVSCQSVPACSRLDVLQSSCILDSPDLESCLRRIYKQDLSTRTCTNMLGKKARACACLSHPNQEALSFPSPIHVELGSL